MRKLCREFLVLVGALTFMQEKAIGWCGWGRAKCRWIQACSDLTCPPEQFSVDCVPKGTDHVCNRNNYSRALLVGNPDFPQSLKARQCNSRLTNDCPLDYVCVPDKEGQGHCCFDQLTSPIPVWRLDPVCPYLRCSLFHFSPHDSCPAEFTCQRMTICSFWSECYPSFRCQPVNEDWDLAVDTVTVDTGDTVRRNETD